MHCGSSIKRITLDQPSWFQISDPPFVNFATLLHWSFMKGAVVDKLWQWETDPQESQPPTPGARPGFNFGENGKKIIPVKYTQFPEAELLDVTQHLMRSEISNSFFCNPQKKLKIENEVETKVLFRMEINHSRQVITLNHVFVLPKWVVEFSECQCYDETLVFAVAYGLRLMADEKQENIFLANMNHFASHTKLIIDRFVKITSNGVPYETAIPLLQNDIRNVMEDIESMVGGRNLEKRKFFLKEGLRKINSILNNKKVEEVKSQENEWKRFLKKVLCGHFKFSFRTIITGSNEDLVNSVVSFLDIYLLQHERHSARYVLSRSQTRICPFLPVQGLVYRQSLKDEFNRKEDLMNFSDDNNPNTLLFFHSELPVLVVDVSTRQLLYVEMTENWEKVRNAARKILLDNIINSEQACARFSHQLKELPGSNSKHQLFNEHIEQVFSIEVSMQRQYIVEFRNLMLRRAFLLKDAVNTSKGKKEPVDLSRLKRIWELGENSGTPVNAWVDQQSEKDYDLVVAWLTHVYPDLGHYARVTRLGMSPREMML